MEQQKINTKVFLGGIPISVTEKELRLQLKKFGSVESILIPRYEDNRSKGFAFINFEEEASATKALSSKINLADKHLYFEPLKPKDEIQKRNEELYKRKIFVGGLSRKVTAEELENYFSKFGEVEKIIMNKFFSNNKSRGSGYVVFKKFQFAKKVFNYKKKHFLKGKKFECHPCLSKEEIKSSRAQKEKKNVSKKKLKIFNFGNPVKNYKNEKKSKKNKLRKKQNLENKKFNQEHMKMNDSYKNQSNLEHLKYLGLGQNYKEHLGLGQNYSEQLELPPNYPEHLKLREYYSEHLELPPNYPGNLESPPNYPEHLELRNNYSQNFFLQENAFGNLDEHLFFNQYLENLPKESSKIICQTKAILKSHYYIGNNKIKRLRPGCYIFLDNFRNELRKVEEKKSIEVLILKSKHSQLRRYGFNDPDNSNLFNWVNNKLK